MKIKALFILYNMSISIAGEVSHCGAKIQPHKEAFHPFVIFKKQHLRLSLYFTEIDAGVFLLKILLVSGKLFEE